MDFPGGSYSDCIEYAINCDEGLLYSMLPEADWKERVPFLFSLDPQVKNFTSDVEINLPLVLNRSVTGCLIRDGISVPVLTTATFR